MVLWVLEPSSRAAWPKVDAESGDRLQRLVLYPEDIAKGVPHDRVERRRSGGEVESLGVPQAEDDSVVSRARLDELAGAFGGQVERVVEHRDQPLGSLNARLCEQQEGTSGQRGRDEVCGAHDGTQRAPAFEGCRTSRPNHFRMTVIVEQRSRSTVSTVLRAR